MVALIPLVLIPLIVFLIPESLRYLQLKGKVEEAVDFLKGKVSSLKILLRKGYLLRFVENVKSRKL